MRHNRIGPFVVTSFVLFVALGGAQQAEAQDATAEAGVWPAHR